MILEPTLTALESLLVAIRSFGVLILDSRTSLTRVLRVSLIWWNTELYSPVRHHLWQLTNGRLCKTAVHLRAIVDGVSRVCEVLKHSSWSRKLRHPFNDDSRDFVQTVIRVRQDGWFRCECVGYSRRCCHTSLADVRMASSRKPYIQAIWEIRLNLFGLYRSDYSIHMLQPEIIIRT